jgi:glutamine kinase
MSILTKSNSLVIINKINKNLVPEFIFFTKVNFLKKKFFYINKIKKQFKNDIIIRSSALNEDLKTKSNAGVYDSFVIKKNNFHQIESYILKIVSKFKHNNDQVLVQSFISNPDIAGVLFTKDKTTNSHYYDINYDTSNKSNLITSGKFNPTIKSLIIYKDSKLVPTKFQKLIKITSDLEKIFKNDRLDIEFIIKKKRVYILQSRPLVGTKKNVKKEKLHEVIINLIKKFKKINQRNETLFGKKTVLSNMSDWNPAEMIGKKPSLLATSLYSELITNSVWSKQRNNYGYKDVYPNKLMLNFAGSPFIDLRVCLNSLLPRELNEKISEKLINYFIKKITKHPELHDKIEFELINTCFDFSLPSKTDLPLNSIEKKEYISSLKNLTNIILNPKNKILDNELKKVELLKKKIIQISKSKLSHIQKIYYLVKDCKKYGTLPFAGIARCAFISKAVLDSLKSAKLLNDIDIDSFYLNINTISKKINTDYVKSKKNDSFKLFIRKYGHLRPSTYSILTKNYKDNYKNYFSNKSVHKETVPIKKFKFKKQQIIEINKIFKKNKLKINFNQFLEFAKISMENREYSKLIFTKSIDEIFKNLKILAKEINVDFKKFEHLDIDIILKSFHFVEQEKLKKTILRNILSNQISYKFSQSIIVPNIVIDSKDFLYHYNLNCIANYITNKTAIGDVIKLKQNFRNLSGKIILIENADPGFDFLFSYKIKGLITKYGGSNSHMAIRCMELGLPAIIGVGDMIYEDFVNSKKVYIDCNNKKYSIIH